MTAHIDTLAQWWDEAEIPNANTLPRDGDRIIIRYNSEWFEIATADGDADESDIDSSTRILARAPKPKPAWHDADFVVARYENDYHWQGYLRHGDLWIDGEGRKYTTGVLRDVTPLIEAKVTDEMVKRARQRGSDLVGALWDAAVVKAMLTAALGLEAV